MANTKKGEDWIQQKWRPAMAVMYIVVCSFDFIIFPIGFTIVQFWEVEAANDAFRQWEPLTLMGAGLFHMAMGAILGVSAWSRGQEKIAGVANNRLPHLSNQNQLYTPPSENIPETLNQESSIKPYVSNTGKNRPAFNEPEL